ncbi:MAG: hypothetical protein Q4F31_06600 [Eubacteriales bacterium]|nr:hypothetical protein [Eubacteriales bacterium]
MKKVLALVLALVMVFALCAYASAEETVKVAYISKMLTNPWFVLQDQALQQQLKSSA